MDFGLTMFPTDYSIPPSELGALAEEHGFESVFFPEHTHIPASRRSPYPFDPEAELPREFSHVMDPFVSLAAVAAATSELRLGVGLCVLPHHDPIILAKVVATLDQVSEGRVILGIGAGWNDEELANHGGHPHERWAVLRERALALRSLWTEEAAEYHGDHVDFDPVWQWPKPRQEPHPPVLVGGRGPHVFDRVAEYGDGWLASGRHESDGDLPARIERLRQRLAREGRTEDVHVTLQEATPDPAVLTRYAEAGVGRCTFRLQPEPREHVLPELRRYRRVVEEFRG